MTLNMQHIFMQQLHIKHMLVFKRQSKRKNVVDLSILLDNNQYIEYSLTFKQSLLTFWVAKRLKSLFIDYFIDNKTDIMLNKTVDEKHPMRVYLDLLRPHIGFKLRTVSFNQIVSRVHYYFYGKGSSKSKFSKVWSTAIKREVCPWITQQVDYALQNKTPVIQHAMKVMRLAMFYMVVKNYMYAKNKMHAERKRQREVV